MQRVWASTAGAGRDQRAERDGRWVVTVIVRCDDVRAWHDQHGELWFSICGWRGTRVNRQTVSPLAKPCPRCGGRKLIVTKPRRKGGRWHESAA